MYIFLNTCTVTCTCMCRFMQISMYNIIIVFSDIHVCTVVYVWCTFQNKTLCTLYAHTCTCTLYTHVQLFFMYTFTCTVDEPDIEPKKKKQRISEDDGEESEHSVQGTVTKLLYIFMNSFMYMYV